MIKLVAAVGGYVEILEAVIVEVTDSNAHSIADALKASFLGHVFKRAIRLLVVETVPVIWAGFLRDGPFGGGILDSSAVD